MQWRHHTFSSCNTHFLSSSLPKLYPQCPSFPPFSPSLVNEEGEVISSEGIELSIVIVEHEYISVKEFELDPIQETLYSLATLIGCFGLLIFVPMIAYFAGVWKEKLEEEEREEEPAPEY